MVRKTKIREYGLTPSFSENYLYPYDMIKKVRISVVYFQH